MSYHRTSRRVLPKREEFQNVARTFANLGFEDYDVPDGDWNGGSNFGRGGYGFYDAFDNLSEFPTGALPLIGAGNRTFTAAGGAGVLVDAGVGGHSLILDCQGDAVPTDSIAVTRFNAGAAVPNPAVGYYSVWIRTTDVTKRGYFIMGDRTGLASFVGMGFNNSQWVVLAAGPAWNILNDLDPPANDTWYHVVVIHTWATNTTQVRIDGVTSGVTGSVFGANPPADISSAYMMTGNAGFGIGTNGTHHVYFDGVDFSEIPDWVLDRNTNELPRTELWTAAAWYFTWTTAATFRTCNIQQNATVTNQIDPRILADIWISQEVFENPTFIGPNLVVNGIFDVNINDWVANNIPTAPFAVGAIAQDLVDPNNGAGALQMTCGANGWCGATNVPIIVNRGLAYELRYYIKAQVNTPAFYAAATYYDAGLDQIGGVDILRLVPASPGVYTQYTDYVYIPPNAHRVRIHFASFGAAADAVNVDDVQLQRASLPYLWIQDVTSGNVYAMTPRYTGEGWYLGDVQGVRTGNNMRIGINGECYYGTLLVDNVRIE